MHISIPCPHCGKKVLLSSAKAFRGNVIACLHCNKQIELVGALMAEVFWAANQH